MDHYEALGVDEHASYPEIKKAFRERAKQIHPDVDPTDGGEKMRMLLAAYETLSNSERRYTYDGSRRRQPRRSKDRPPFESYPAFDFRSYLIEEAAAGNGEARARLIFFELVHLRGESAIQFWREGGGQDFPLHKYFDREDWMDFAYSLAEELSSRGAYHEAFILLVEILKAEAIKPYFRHFAGDVKTFLKDLVRTKLKRSVDEETWINCLRQMLDLGFGACEEKRWRDDIKKHT
ncbi:MAG: DnaJ domain-containing protein [Spirochaetaceae bacterium]|jgi:curved DNA-binding protein CbpA|nr:DnaJ domain-containing protein [Spirochaetaceae bacterium]